MKARTKGQGRRVRRVLVGAKRTVQTPSRSRTTPATLNVTTVHFPAKKKTLELSRDVTRSPSRFDELTFNNETENLCVDVTVFRGLGKGFFLLPFNRMTSTV